MIQRNTLSTASTPTPPPRDEKELVERFQNGEQEVFNELVSKYQGKIYNLVYKYVPNSEIAQEIFLKKSLSKPSAPCLISNDNRHSIVGSIGLPSICALTSFVNKKRGQTLSFEDLPHRGQR